MPHGSDDGDHQQPFTMKPETSGEYTPLNTSNNTTNTSFRNESYTYNSSYNRSSHWESLGREDGGFKRYPTATHHIKTETHWRILLIVGGLLLALGFATGHHFYLSSISNKDVRLTGSQFWVRAINNLFSHVVAITLGVVCTYSTVQAVWYTAGTHPTSILTLNRLFSLPTPSAIGGLLMRPSLHLVPPLLIAIAMQALVLVTIFSPSTLTTGQADSRLVNISVPTLDLSQNEMYSTDQAHQQPTTNQTNTGHGDLGFNVLPRWNQIISTAMTTPPTTYWRVPPGCGAACSYQLSYSAPALECRDLSDTEMTLSQFTTGWAGMCVPNEQPFYRGNSSFAFIHDNTNTLQMGDSGDLVIQYMVSNPENPRTGISCPFFPSVRRGVSCAVRQAEYQLSYKLSNNVQSVSSSILRYSDTNTTRNSQSENNSSGGRTLTVGDANSIVLSTLFTVAFSGEIYLSGSIARTNLFNELAVRRLFTLQDTTLTNQFDFQPILDSNGTTQHTFKETLVNAFANMTIGLMAFRSENTTVGSMVWDGSIVWKYDRHTLLLIYGLAVGLVSLASLYGMFCLWRNQGAIDTTFSTFLLTVTRTNELSDRFKVVRDMEEVEKTKLRFSNRKESFVLYAK